MLRFLSIRRLAVIDALEVEFGPGLNVLTGETGAGKSVLVGAVSLLLGGRASAEFVRTGEESAIVEAAFDRPGSSGADLGEVPDEELLVRREITASGRSRAFVDGNLTTAGALKDLSARLIELHGQHEHQTLLDPSTHLAVLDGFGGLEDELRPVEVAFTSMRAAAGRLEAATGAAANRQATEELAALQFQELDRAGLKPREDETLAAERKVLANAERVASLCAESYAALYESDESALARLGLVWRKIAELATVDPSFQPYLDGRDQVKSQLEDLAMFLSRYGEGIDTSPARLQQIEERLALLERLKRTYGPTLADAIARRDALEQELADLEQTSEEVAALGKLAAEAQADFLNRARGLSAARQKSSRTFVKALEGELADLAMEHTRFEVRFSAAGGAETWAATGIDRVEFFVSPNPGEDLRPLARIISGGELSRIMLALKTLSARSRRMAGDQAPGLVFDEVDAGIGGRVAEVVGAKLKALGSSFQVLCITHLPQIAACADAHFHIAKSVAGGRTTTTVRRLDSRERVEELGRLLAGSRVTEQVRSTAREMLASRANSGQAKGEAKSKGESERAKAKPRTAAT